MSGSIFVGNDAKLTFTIRIRTTGVVVDLTATGINVTRMIYSIAGISIDSSALLFSQARI